MTSSSVLFDDFVYDGAMDYTSVPPIWTIDTDSAKAGDKSALEDLHKWLCDDIQAKLKLSESRLRHYRQNLALYKGIHYRDQETRSQNFRNDEAERSVRNPKVVVNHCYDMVETKVAKLSRFKPSVAFMPSNDEYTDKNNARIAKMLVDNRWYEVDIEKVYRDHQRATFIYGESYMRVLWNKNLGDVHPYYTEMKAAGEQINAMDKTGQTILDADGKEIELKGVIRVGDVEYKIITPDYLFPEIKRNWEEVSNVSETEYLHVDTLKAMYPELAAEIREYKGQRYDPEQYFERKNTRETQMVTLWVQPQEFLPAGLKVVYTEDVILSVEDFPYEDAKLPYIRLTDIDVPNEQYARSFLQVIKQMQMHYNNLASAIARNHGLAAAPKWMMPKGACKVTSLGNDATIVEYAGAVPPTLATFPTTPAEIYNYMQTLKSEIQEKSGVHGISTGNLPPGVDAAIAMQFLDEQEAERANNAVVKRIQVIKECAKMSISRMGQFYKAEDGRLIRILGKDNSYLIKSIDMADFSKPYDVRCQNSSALPDSKALKIQSLINLNMAFPGMFRQEQIVDMLDLGSVESFKDKATVAVKSAESENDSMLNGEDVVEPKKWEDLVIHYDIHMKALQERSFKEEVPSDYQAKLILHITVTEMLIWERASKNSLFRQMVMTSLPQYPVFFKLDADSQMFMSGMMPQAPVSAPSGKGGSGGKELMNEDQQKLAQSLPGEEAKPGNVYLQ